MTLAYGFAAVFKPYGKTTHIPFTTHLTMLRSSSERTPALAKNAGLPTQTNRTGLIAALLLAAALLTGGAPAKADVEPSGAAPKVEAVERLEKAVLGLTGMLDSAQEAFLLTQWGRLKAALLEHRQELAETFSLQEVVTRKNEKIGSMIAPGIAEQQQGLERDIRDWYAIALNRETLGEAPLSADDVIRLFQGFYNPGNDTKAYDAFTKEYYRAALRAGQYLQADGKTPDQKPIIAHRNAMVETGNTLIAALKAKPEAAAKVATALNNAIAYITEHKIHYGPEATRKLALHTASAVMAAGADAGQPRDLVADITYTISPYTYLHGIPPVKTVKRADRSLDITNTNQAAVAEAYKQVTGFALTQEQKNATARFARDEFINLAQYLKVLELNAQTRAIEEETLAKLAVLNRERAETARERAEAAAQRKIEEDLEKAIDLAKSLSDRLQAMTSGLLLDNPTVTVREFTDLVQQARAAQLTVATLAEKSLSKKAVQEYAQEYARALAAIDTPATRARLKQK